MGQEYPENDRTKSYCGLAVGTMVSHYRIVDRIGAGGMGEVYLAEDTELSRRVALKFLSDTLAVDPDCKTRFKREAQAAAKLGHPNIVTVYEVGEYNGRPFFAMEFVEGQSLRELIRRKEMVLAQAIDIAVQICEGLKEAHAAGIIHRDIKPSNVLYDNKGRCRILDFGLAAFEGCEPVTRSGSTIGTVGYMSPEQVRGEATDARSDLFSLGVVLYEMVAGRRPFRGEYEAAILYSVTQEEPEPLARYKAGVPDEMQRIVTKALAKSRDKRYQHADELAVDLKRLRTELEGQTSDGRVLVPDTQPSVAVLPFVNLSADREQEYFCDGMAEEIISGLTHIEGLRVAARTSAFSFKGKEADIREIGKKLGVAAVLEGSVRKAGNRLRITAQLIDVTDGCHLWSEKYDRDLEDIFAIQDEISLAIVDKLKVKLLKDEKARLVKRYTDDQEAYQLYLKGRYFWNRRYEGGLQKGIECFQQAIDKDPMYALAYVGVADCYNQLAHWGYLAALETYPKAKRAAEKALEIDDTLAEAHASMGWIRLFFDWDWVASENEFKRAIALNPNYAPAHEWYGLLLAIMGRTEEGFVQEGHALAQDPLSLIITAVLGLGLFWARRYDDALEELDKTLEKDPDFALANLFKAWTCLGKGRWNEAIASAQKFAALTQGSSVAVGHLGFAYARAGRKDEAIRMLRRLDDIAEARYVSPLYRAQILLALGETDRAFEHLDQAVAERESFLPTLKTSPLWDQLRADPRFPALLKKIGFE